MATLSGEVIFHFHFASHLIRGQFLKKKNLLPLEQFLSFKSRPYFERVALSKKANSKSQKLFPFVKMIENKGGELIHLKPTFESMQPSQTVKVLCHQLSLSPYIMSAKSIGSDQSEGWWGGAMVLGKLPVPGGCY